MIKFGLRLLYVTFTHIILVIISAQFFVRSEINPSLTT